MLKKLQKSIFSPSLAVLLAFMFVATSSMTPVQAQSLSLPQAGSMLGLSPAHTPTLLKGLTIHPDHPLQFNFIVTPGDEALGQEELQKESERLIRYFLASLTIPEKELWVNLSPYEKDRIIPESLSRTEMGKELLAQDYMLKQLSASLTYPESELGQKFWERIRAKALDLYGVSDIPLNTFNKIWIVPQGATIYEHGQTVFVFKSHLKVMLEEDFLALEENAHHLKTKNAFAVEEDKIVRNVHSEIVRTIIIPEIEKEVNEGETFASLRQIYHSMILATWYKKNLRESVLGKSYVDQNKVSGIDTVGKGMKEEIYNQYLETFKAGVYDYIKEDYDVQSEEVIPRKYFAGGLGPVQSAKLQEIKVGEDVQADQDFASLGMSSRNSFVVETNFKVKDQAMTSRLVGKLEKAVAALEARGLSAAHEGVSYVSGMTAIEEMYNFALEQKLVKGSDRVDPNEAEVIVFRPCYGCTDNLGDDLKGIAKVRTVSDVEGLKAALNDHTIFVFFETPTNPKVGVLDIEEVVQAVKAKREDILVGMDNTFATSLGQQPLKYGVDISFVGLTKGMSGSGDVLGGMLVARPEITKRLKRERSRSVETIDALDAEILLNFGLPTLAKRLERQEANAKAYLRFFKNQSDLIAAISYPGDPESPQFKIAQKQMDNFGSMMSIDFQSNEMATAFLNSTLR